MARVCLFSLVLAFVTACGPKTQGGDDDDTNIDAMPGSCTDGARQCAGNVLQTCENGVYTDTETCANACDNELGCVFCVPGTGECDGDISHACNEEGTAIEDVYCDPVQGMTCGSSGICEGACSPHEMGQTFFGCDFYPTVTGNMVAGTYDFAVAIANTSNTTANITIEEGGLGAPDVFTVPGNASVVRLLPWVQTLKLCSTTGTSYFDCYGVQQNAALAAKGAYHLRSDVPVTIYQFNPLQYTEPGALENSYTNDASLIFPTNAWEEEYYVASWQNTAGVNPGLLAVIASQDGTTVTLTTKADTPAAQGAPAFATGVAQDVLLNRGDVLEVATLTGDLTGSHVLADKPVQVIGGHFCANVPDGFGYCDHMEESMLSIDAMGAKYIINAPAVTTIPNGKEEMVRIIAVEANTTLTYDPPQAGAPDAIANPGDWVEIPRQAASYMIESNNKILVAQYMEGSTAGGGTGDPAVALAVPIDQFRTSYLFHAPTNYETNYVDITAPAGSSVTLDGVAVTNFVDIGTSGWRLARIVPLGPGPLNDGNHSITGDMGFGITVYGYGQDTSYWYPGGLDLKRVIVE